MGRHNRAPVGHTCPDIDAAIRDFGRMMEDLRTSNGSLRDWGENESERADKEEARADELEEKAEDLQSDLDDALARIRELEEEVRQKDSEIEELVNRD